RPRARVSTADRQSSMRSSRSACSEAVVTRMRTNSVAKRTSVYTPLGSSWKCRKARPRSEKTPGRVSRRAGRARRSASSGAMRASVAGPACCTGCRASSRCAGAAARPLRRHCPRAALRVRAGLVSHGLDARDRRLALDVLGGVDRLGDARRHVRVVLQEPARVLAALADPLARVRVPGAGLLDDAGLAGEIEDVA